MRSETEMFDLIMGTAAQDERIRAVILNGSRANPNAVRDIFQDYDIVYVVKDVASFTDNHEWIDCFGALMILQMPEEMLDPPPLGGATFTYLMQFADGNRIDLTLVPLAQLDEMGRDSLSKLLLDKDGLIEPFGPATEDDYIPRPPTAKLFDDCCNEFWWVSTYVAKGLWRGEIIFAKAMCDQVIRPQLMKVLDWHIGVQTHFTRNPGKLGKHYPEYLEAELWELYLATYADANYDNTWDALFHMCGLFSTVARTLAEHYQFEYPAEDERRVRAHLQHVRTLPRDAAKIY